jgi:tRNA(Ile)-lysidine synthase
VVQIDSTASDDQGPEGSARAARYRALADLVRPNEILLTGHHRDDQAETLLLALLRGGGVHGWAGMPVRASLGCGVHLRPWLDIPRRCLLDELERHGMEVVDDPANRDPSYDRAWLRHEVLPVLRRRWSQVDSTLARAADHAAEAAANVDAMAAHDFSRCRGAYDGRSRSLRWAHCRRCANAHCCAGG